METLQGGCRRSGCSRRPLAAGKQMVDSDCAQLSILGPPLLIDGQVSVRRVRKGGRWLEAKRNKAGISRVGSQHGAYPPTRCTRLAHSSLVCLHQATLSHWQTAFHGPCQALQAPGGLTPQPRGIGIGMAPSPRHHGRRRAARARRHKPTSGAISQEPGAEPSATITGHSSTVSMNQTSDVQGSAAARAGAEAVPHVSGHGQRAWRRRGTSRLNRGASESSPITSTSMLSRLRLTATKPGGGVPKQGQGAGAVWGRRRQRPNG